MIKRHFSEFVGGKLRIKTKVQMLFTWLDVHDYTATQNPKASFLSNKYTPKAQSSRYTTIDTAENKRKHPYA